MYSNTASAAVRANMQEACRVEMLAVELLVQIKCITWFSLVTTCRCILFAKAQVSRFLPDVVVRPRIASCWYVSRGCSCIGMKLRHGLAQKQCSTVQ